MACDMRTTALFCLLSCAALTEAATPTESCDCRQCRADPTPAPPEDSAEGTAEEAMDCASYLAALREFYSRAEALAELLGKETGDPDARVAAVAEQVEALRPALDLVQMRPPQAEPGLLLQVETGRQNGGVICSRLCRSVVLALESTPALREPLAPIVQKFCLSTKADYTEEEWQAAQQDLDRLQNANETLLCALPLLESVRNRTTADGVAPELTALHDDLARAAEAAQKLLDGYVRSPQTAWATANGLTINTARLIRVLDKLMNTEPRCYGSDELASALEDILTPDPGAEEAAE